LTGARDDEVAVDARALLDLTGHGFRDAELAATALTHRSWAHESGRESNERLEYLGDAVLALVISRELYQRHPGWSEGELTRARAAIINTQSLADRARSLGLGGFVKLSREADRAGGRERDSIMADCFEAVLGAMFLDAGLAPVETLLLRCFGEALTEGPIRDAKTAFQEFAHARFQTTPRYVTVADSEVENDEHRFTVEARVDDEAWGTGVGRTKRAAEQAAAQAGLDRNAELS
jgi:ribonuclease-3